MAPSKDRICYFYDSDVGTGYYGNNHPMKPHRLAIMDTNSRFGSRTRRGSNKTATK